MPDDLLLPQPDQRGVAAADRHLLVVHHPRAACPPFDLRASPERERLEQVHTLRDAFVHLLDGGGGVDKDIGRYDLPLDGITAVVAVSAELVRLGVGIDEDLG